MRLPLTWLFVTFFCTCLSAQKQEDLREDAVFFEKQAKIYQRWLDHAGFGQYVKFRELEIKEKELSIYLEFKATEVDSIVNQWLKLKEVFEVNSALSLEQKLFYKASTLMEVKHSALSVELYNTYDKRKEITFARFIHFVDEQVKVEDLNPRSEIQEINLSPSAISGGKELSVVDIREDYDKRRVFDCIIAYATERFEQKKCTDRNPKVTVPSDQGVLIIEVEDLCREVLKKDNSIICGWLQGLGFDCNWAKREMLTFKISHENTLEGVRITIELDGKIGSGFYENVERGGYVEMEIDRDAELELYAGEFAIAVRKMLATCR